MLVRAGEISAAQGELGLTELQPASGNFRPKEIQNSSMPRCDTGGKRVLCMHMCVYE